MQHQDKEPAEELRDVIKGFWYGSIDFTALPSGFEILPDGYTEIIFCFGSAFSLSTREGLRLLPSPFLVGLLGQPILLHAANRLEVIGIKCFPWTVFDLLGLPSNKDGVRIFEHPIAGLQPKLKKLIEAGNIEKALAEVEQYFLHVRAQLATNSMLFKAGDAMREAGGNIPVSQIAAVAHATVRTLERNFKQASGHTVKDVSALIRFEQARDKLWCYPDTNLADLAEELGYTDRPHLNREFKRYSNTTPAAFAREIKKRKQTITSDFVAFIQK